MTNQQKVIRGLTFGLVAGWVVGMLWWAALAISFAWHDEDVSHFRMVVYAPLMAIPWGVVGGVVGAVIGWKGGRLEVLTSFLGMVCGLGLLLALEYFDGWLTITMPLAAFLGTFAGLAAGGIGRVVSRSLNV
jgi:hypothetical protein